MGLLSIIKHLGFGSKKTFDTKSQKVKSILRRCHFEIMEPRQVLSADPVIAGVTYLEGDLGQDNTPDFFEVTFEGGAATTQLTQFTINGDQDLSGDLSDGDMFFDVDSALPGTGGHHAFQFDASASVGITESDILNVTVGKDGLSLTVDVKNFEAGDVLAFQIDVDEVERLRVDKIASGVEFEATMFEAEFVDQNYVFEKLDVNTSVTLDGGFVQPQQAGIFYDTYDKILGVGGDLAGETLALTLDNAEGKADRTAGGIDAYSLVPKPITISGNVYHDENLNCEHDANESGILGVKIDLQLLNEQTGVYETVASTLTNGDGAYEFGADLNLMPGNYRLVETQPNGYLDVGAEAGSVEGITSGDVENDSSNQANVISNIDIPLGGNAATNYDFKEVRPTSIAGTVWHDRNDDGNIDAGEEGIANVLIRVNRVSAPNGVSVDPFADTQPIFVRTDADGNYQVDGLPPGIYEVVEINSYPNGADPLAAFVDGKDSVGNVLGTTVGSKTNDRFGQIVLNADDAGVEYNFGELKPAEISGYVSVETPEGHCLDPSDPNHVGIEGVEVQLLDINGDVVATTTTNQDGRYEFDGLRPGIYTVVEVQPDGYIDGRDSRGTIDGRHTVSTDANDEFRAISLSSGSVGEQFNFCEKLPAEISGIVWHDSNDDGVIDAGEERIGGVVIQLLNTNGDVVSETRTNAQGAYSFENLMPGTYSVMEVQPVSFADGKDSLGSVAGVDGTNEVRGAMENDKFVSVQLKGGDEGTNYNFGEIRLASISGRVHADANGDCTFEASEGDHPLPGVQVVLLNANGDEVARTTTDDNGEYEFSGLRPGEYTIREATPDGYVDGGEKLGTVDGVTVGTLANDRISKIVLSSGSEAVNYDFCEHIPAEIQGTVYHDRNDDGIQDAGEEGIANTRIVLIDADGKTVAETRTNAAGEYQFTGLIAGEYQILEFQPNGFSDGKDTVGMVDSQTVGTKTNDRFVNIQLMGGDRGVEYNFGELKTAQISGYVHLDPDGDCVFDVAEGEEGLANVKLELLNEDGDVVATTTTNAEGYYEFTNVLPGEYSIRETQPNGLFTAGETVAGQPAPGGVNEITEIVVESGQNLTQHNFCENEPAEIHGRVWEDGPAFETESGELPTNYRELRDGVYNADVDSPIAGVRMQLYYFIDPTIGIDGSISPRPVKLSEVMSDFYDHMGTTDPDAPVWVETDANGEYSFLGLQPGNYIVLEIQPENFADSNDSPGTTSGLTYNSPADTQTANAAVLRTFSVDQVMDSVIGIQLTSGVASFQNNFSEVRVEEVGDPQPPVLEPPEPPRSSNPETPRPGLTALPGLAGAQSASVVPLVATSRGVGAHVTNATAPAYTWHLSVVNGGNPRALAEAVVSGQGDVWKLASHIANNDWTRFDMNEATWLFTESKDFNAIELSEQSTVFGMIDGIPLAGDFDGDGFDQVAIYRDGYWFIDINQNGRWDEDDLMARLGDAEDRPVVGDWDGDGKDDIGIYGPIWDNDPDAIAHEPGLPNPDNSPFTRPKNLPPVDADMTSGARTMKLTNFGKQRADIVDHVFGIGEQEQIPVAGDWNGNGIRSIGYFQDGVWNLDMNGDGEFDHNDVVVNFGAAGDIPLVGDFDGDGIEDIAVYRSGTWMIDVNGNREFDAADKTFELGTAHDQPVVGDFDGDGIDEPALYRDHGHSL